MKKYLAKLIFNVNIENSAHTEFDEQIRMIEAHDLESAFLKARNVGRREEESFINNSNQLVNWTFIDVSEIYLLDTIKDGEQVYSNTRKIKDSHSFISYVRQKSMEIQAKNLTFA
ncbi:MAG: DUF4288 domain-containing protein [Bacteroidetes bacterium]|nr:DUF4288 domain-containing protein [Bacteroidota bacterium]